MRTAQYKWRTAARDHVEDLRAQVSLLEHINLFHLCDAVVLCYRIYVKLIMFVRKLPYIIYRAYPTSGYLTDNRNFGYDTATKSCTKVGDLLLSHEGSIFYSVLKEEYQKVDEIACRLLNVFEDVNYEMLREDAIAFYNELSKKGFIICDTEPRDNVQLPTYFSYENTQPISLDLQSGLCANFEEFTNEYYLSRVHIDISSRCNENCVHCYIPSKNKCSIMSEEIFDRVLEQCVSMRVLNITLSGGEPMLNPYLKSFLLKCRDANFSVNILSNLTCLSDELLELISSNPLISVQTSLYAMNEEIHDSITQKIGSYKKTLSAIRRLHECNVPMQINCPIMKQNRHCYHEVLDFAQSLNIEASSDYSLFGCYDKSEGNLDCRISTCDVLEILDKDCRNENKLKEIVQSIDGKRVNDTDSICSVCKSSLCISNNGDVYPCEGWQQMILGNVIASSLKYIWEDAPLTKHLRELKYQDFVECSICQNRKYCTTCLIMNANEKNGDYMTVNSYMCELAKIKKYVIEKVQNNNM